MRIYKNGEKAYIIISGNEVAEVTVIRRSGDIYTLRLPSKGAIRLKSGRLYASEPEAMEKIVKTKVDPKADFWNQIGPYKYLI